MKTVTILWLYPQLLDLYGDSGNLLLLRKRLEEMGHSCQVKTVGLGDTVDFEGVDLVYVGPGKARNLKAAAEHLSGYASQLQAYIQGGGLVLATGSAQVLFGRDYDGVSCAGILDYTATETGQVDIADVVGHLDGEPQELCYGFVNRTCYLSQESGQTPVFHIHPRTQSPRFPQNTEGHRLHNYYGTWMLGPVLVKNPAFARRMLAQLLGKEMGDYDDTLERTALEYTLGDILK